MQVLAAYGASCRGPLLTAISAKEGKMVAALLPYIPRPGPEQLQLAVELGAHSVAAALLSVGCRAPGALQAAISRQDKNMVALLLRYGAHVGSTELKTAALLDSDAMLRLLLPGTSSPFWWALQHNEEELFKVMLNRRHRPAPQRAELLHWAVVLGKLWACKELVAAGDCLDALDETGRTPLHTAASAGNGAVITYLLDSGASTAVRDEDDESALDIAVSLYSKEAVEALLADPMRWDKGDILVAVKATKQRALQESLVMALAQHDLRLADRHRPCSLPSCVLAKLHQLGQELQAARAEVARLTEINQGKCRAMQAAVRLLQGGEEPASKRQRCE